MKKIEDSLAMTLHRLECLKAMKEMPEILGPVKLKPLRLAWLRLAGLFQNPDK